MLPENTVSIYDVAREAGVSIATVSRVLNNNANVSQKSRNKVLYAREKLNYQPSPIARAMVNKKMQAIGIMTVDIRSENYNVAAYTIERNFADLGYSSMICNTLGSPEDNINAIRMLIDKGVSGIICIGSVFDRTFNETKILSEFSNIPFIITNYPIEADNVCCIDFNERIGIEKAIACFVSRGHRDISFIKDVNSYSSNKKAKEFLSLMNEYGIPTHKNSILETSRSLEGGAAAIDSLAASGRPFSALLFNDDITAIGGLKRLTALGYKIPEEVAVIGYNNTSFAKYCTPELTSVSTNFETLGSLAVTLLMNLIEGKNTTRSILISPELIIREST